MKLLRNVYDGINISLIHVPTPIRRLMLKLLSYLPFSLTYPKVFMIEPTNICNGLCPLCPIGARIDTRRKGHLKYDDFVKLIDEVKDFAKLIIMNFAGEPFLNPQIGKLAGYAESKGIRTVIGTNGTIDKSDELVASGASEILFSLDGASEESYRKYRTYKDGKGFDLVVDNLKKLVEKKSNLGADKPAVILQFVVFKHNQHEIDEIIELGRKIGVDAVDLKPVCINDFFEEPLEELIEKFLPEDQTHYRFKDNKIFLRKPPLCSFCFHETEILWNGDVTTCCYDYNGDYVIGNLVKDGGFKKIWRSPEYRKIRRKIVMQELKICRTCDNTLVKPARIIFERKPAS